MDAREYVAETVPNSFADVTAEWLTAVLRSSGHLENEIVVARAIAPLGPFEQLRAVPWNSYSGTPNPQESEIRVQWMRMSGRCRDSETHVPSECPVASRSRGITLIPLAQPNALGELL